MTAKLLIIGSGTIAAAHVQANSELLAAGLAQAPLPVHVTDRSDRALADFVSSHPGVTAHRSTSDLLALPHDESDIVIVATPPTSHAELVSAALASGRHVIAEKPLCLPADRAAQLAWEAERAGLELHDASNRFVGTAVNRAVASLVATGELGRIYHASWVHVAQRARPGIEFLPGTHWFTNRAIAGGGVGIDWSGYDLATLAEALGARRFEVAGQYAAMPTIDDALPPGTIKDVEFHLGAQLLAHTGAGAVPVTYERASATHAQPVERVEIVGTAGSVSWQWLPWPGDHTALRLTRDEAGSPVTEVREFPNAGQTSFHSRPLHAMQARLIGRQDPALPAVTARQAAANLAIIEQLIRMPQADVEARPRPARVEVP